MKHRGKVVYQQFIKLTGRLKKRKGRALKVKRESVDVLWKRNPEIGVLHVIRTGIAGNEF